MDLDSLQKFHDSLPESYPSLLSISDCVHWSFTEHDTISWVSWNSDRKEYLESYQCYVPEGYIKDDKHLMVNLDTQTGTWQTEIFSLSNQLQPDEFWDKYEEHF